MMLATYHKYTDVPTQYNERGEFAGYAHTKDETVNQMAVAIRGYFQEGAGHCAMRYEVKLENGEWISITKKEGVNPSLPRISKRQCTIATREVRTGRQIVYKHSSEEIAL